MVNMLQATERHRLTTARLKARPVPEMISPGGAVPRVFSVTPRLRGWILGRHPRVSRKFRCRG